MYLKVLFYIKEYSLNIHPSCLFFLFSLQLQLFQTTDISKKIFWDPELQIKGGTEHNSKVIFLFLNESICCDSSLELSKQDGSNEG